MTSLSLFDRADDPAGLALCSVSELTAQIKEILEVGFAEVALRAEVSNLARPRSGHVYLSLKDDAVAGPGGAVEERRAAAGLRPDRRPGGAGLGPADRLRAAGRIPGRRSSRSSPRGSGRSSWRSARRWPGSPPRGCSTRPGSGRCPAFPRRIVVVTSPTGAAVRDLLQVTGRRWRAAEILIAPSRVQGAGAAEEIAAAIALANRVAGADLIIVARGGGSLEDLWAFNEEVVARAIVALAAAGRLGHRPRDRRDHRRPRRRPPRPDPQRGRRALRARRPRGPPAPRPPGRPHRPRRPGPARARPAPGSTASPTAPAAPCGRDLDGRRHRLARLAASLEALSPLAVLARGYSLTFQADGTTLRPLGRRRPPRRPHPHPPRRRLAQPRRGGRTRQRQRRPPNPYAQGHSTPADRLAS